MEIENNQGDQLIFIKTLQARVANAEINTIEYYRMKNSQKELINMMIGLGSIHWDKRGRLVPNLNEIISRIELNEEEQEALRIYGLNYGFRYDHIVKNFIRAGLGLKPLE